MSIQHKNQSHNVSPLQVVIYTPKCFPSTSLDLISFTQPLVFILVVTTVSIILPNLDFADEVGWSLGYLSSGSKSSIIGWPFLMKLQLEVLFGMVLSCLLVSCIVRSSTSYGLGGMAQITTWT